MPRSPGGLWTDLDASELEEANITGEAGLRFASRADPHWVTSLNHLDAAQWAKFEFTGARPI